MRLLIVDYKTDTLIDGSRSRHAGATAARRRCMRAPQKTATGLEVAGVVFVFARAGAVRRVRYRPLSCLDESVPKQLDVVLEHGLSFERVAG